MGNGISIVSAAINLAKLMSDLGKYPDKKFEKILKELRSNEVDPENIFNILSVIVEGQRCEWIEVIRLLGFFEKKKLVIKNHFT